MPQATPYDAIVIGTTYGSRLLPSAFAEAGKKVAVIERDHLGGTCVNRGCTPTKTMVASAHVAYLARRGEDYGVHIGPEVGTQGPERRRTGASRTARMSVVNACNLATKEHPSGDSIIAHRRSPV